MAYFKEKGTVDLENVEAMAKKGAKMYVKALST